MNVNCATGNMLKHTAFSLKGSLFFVVFFTNDFRSCLCHEVIARTNLCYDINRRCGLSSHLEAISLYFPTVLIHCDTRQVIG